jgi:hypothetical protein
MRIAEVQIEMAGRDLRPEPTGSPHFLPCPAPLAEIAAMLGQELPKSCLHSLVFQAVSELFAQPEKVKEWFRFEGQLSKMQMNPS